MSHNVSGLITILGKSIVFEKYYYYCNVINTFILLLPRLHRHGLQIFHCRLRIIADEGLAYYL